MAGQRAVSHLNSGLCFPLLIGACSRIVNGGRNTRLPGHEKQMLYPSVYRHLSQEGPEHEWRMSQIEITHISSRILRKRDMKPESQERDLTDFDSVVSTLSYVFTSLRHFEVLFCTAFYWHITWSFAGLMNLPYVQRGSHFHSICRAAVCHVLFMHTNVHFN